jgi:hypothetical protein
MYLTPHAAVGVLISQHVDRPVTAFLLAFLSHLVLDFIPHGDEHVGDWMKVRFRRMFFVGAFDLSLIFVFTIFLLSAETEPAQTSLYLAGIFGAVLPDFLSMVFPTMHEKLNWFFLVRWVHALLHKSRVTFAVRGINWLHERLHKFLLRRYNMRLSLIRGMIFQAIFLVFILIFIFDGL